LNAGIKLISFENIKFIQYADPDQPIWDYSHFVKKHNLDYIFTLHVRCFGHTLDKNGGPPVGVTFLVGFLVDGSTNKLVWQYPLMVREPVVGEWNQPPDYPNLTKAIVKSLETALNQVYVAFFKKAP